jgi:threonine dehydratase
MRLRLVVAFSGWPGLATGVSLVLKALAPGAGVICVQPLSAPAIAHSWRPRCVVTTHRKCLRVDARDRRP